LVPYGMTALLALTSKIDKKWDLLEEVQLFNVPPYLRIPKAEKDEIRRLKRTEIVLEDGKCLNNDNYIVVEVENKEEEELVSDSLYGNSTVYPVFVRSQSLRR
jgi:hypothetical protein